MKLLNRLFNSETGTSRFEQGEELVYRDHFTHDNVKVVVVSDLKKLKGQRYYEVRVRGNGRVIPWAREKDLHYENQEQKTDNA